MQILGDHVDELSHGVEGVRGEHEQVKEGATALHLYFFFQAEDGIRDLTVTGVQTCALPISRDLLKRENRRSVVMLGPRAQGPPGFQGLQIPFEARLTTRNMRRRTVPAAGPSASGWIARPRPGGSMAPLRSPRSRWTRGRGPGSRIGPRTRSRTSPRRAPSRGSP